jgi:thiamine-phosphate pyrophosphorylase
VFDANWLTLMAITDGLHDGIDGLVGRAAAAVRGGATCVQLRLKHADARTLVEVGRTLVQQVGAPVLVNDRVDVALACGAAGVHLGADDLPVAAVRRLTPAGFVIGASVGDAAEVGNAHAADYVGVGPVYATLSKLDAGEEIGIDRFVELARLAARPAVAIGGITADNAAATLAAGAAGVAVIRSVMSAPSPEAAARELRRAIGR